MTVNKDIFVAETDEAKEAFAIEDLVFSVQIALQKVMHKQGVGHKELAERLGMSPARVSQIFADNGPNLTLKTIARIQHALGKEFVFVEKCVLEKQKSVNERKLVNFSGGKIRAADGGGWDYLDDADKVVTIRAVAA